MKDAREAYKEIQEVIIPNVASFFGHKAMDYDSGQAFMFLGAKGQFGDINRKFWKLYKALWKEEELVGENAVEILYDLAGHIFLTIWLLQQQAEERGEDLAERGNCKYCGAREMEHHLPGCRALDDLPGGRCKECGGRELHERECASAPICRKCCHFSWRHHPGCEGEKSAYCSCSSFEPRRL